MFPRPVKRLVILVLATWLAAVALPSGAAPQQKTHVAKHNAGKAHRLMSAGHKAPRRSLAKKPVRAKLAAARHRHKAAMRPMKAAEGAGGRLELALAPEAGPPVSLREPRQVCRRDGRIYLLADCAGLARPIAAGEP